MESLNPLHFSSMVPSCYTARIQQIRDLAPKVRELTFDLVEPGPTALHFHPGQSMAVMIPSSEHEAETVRYYSIASPPSQLTSFRILLSVADQGLGSTYLYQQSKGAQVQCQGPSGNFQFHNDDTRGILFVATGTGIAPFRSMLSALFEKPLTKPVRLIWGLRSEQDLYYQEELQNLAEQHPRFSFEITLSRANARWSGATGRVTDLVSQLPSVENLAVYICGHRKMVHEVADIVSQKGDAPIYQEEFISKK